MSAGGVGHRFWRDLREAVAGSLIGAEPALRLLAVAMLADGHALVEDVPGTGKTTIARAFAQALGLSFARVQGTPDLLPGDVTGSSLYEGGAFRFVPGPIFTNILLVDEINRATPRTQSALLEAMQERQVSIDGETHRLPGPFLVLATENPIELEGTFALPEAQLDRFLVRTSVGYPTEANELLIAGLYRDGSSPVEGVRRVCSAQEVLELQDAASRITVSDDVGRYVVALVRASRQHPDVRLGRQPSSERGAVPGRPGIGVPGRARLRQAGRRRRHRAGGPGPPDPARRGSRAPGSHGRSGRGPARHLDAVAHLEDGLTVAPLVVAGALLVGGVLSAAPGIILLAVLTVMTAWLSTLWSRYGLAHVSYRRHLANDRAVWGDRVDLDVTIENRKTLPLAWLRAEDFVTDGLEIVGHALSSSGRYGFSVLQNVWSLGSFERVVRRHQIDATHRGRLQFDAVRLTVADLFGRDAASRELDLLDTLLVRPRTVPVRTARGAVVPLGARRALRGLVEDPSLFAGVRPFQAGDPRRRIHQRAFARTGRPLSKRFDPSTARQIVDRARYPDRERAVLEPGLRGGPGREPGRRRRVPCPSPHRRRSGMRRGLQRVDVQPRPRRVRAAPGRAATSSSVSRTNSPG